MSGLFGLSDQAKLSLLARVAARKPAPTPAPSAAAGAQSDAPQLGHAAVRAELDLVRRAADTLGLPSPYFRAHAGVAGATSRIGNQDYDNFASYNYLGLNGDSRVSEAAKQAIARWGKDASQIDAVICAASNMQRAYPAMAIEVQQALGIGGFAFDMNVACSSATFGIKTAADFVTSGSARAVLMVNPEICSGHLNFRDRDSHFIFGDVATAVIVEAADQATGGWDILGTRLKTQFSNKIRNNFGSLNRAAPDGIGAVDKLFVQEGRKVFREVVPMVSDMIVEHAGDLGIDPTGLKRLWLHQANINMNEMIGRRVLGRDPAPGENVIILDEFANTSSAGSIIAFHRANDDFAAGETGLICSFGAGYSAGTVFVRKR